MAYDVCQHFVPLGLNRTTKRLAELNGSPHSPPAAGLIALQPHIAGEFVFLFAIKLGS